MADEQSEDGSEARRHRRGLKFRKRDDYAVELFREAQAVLEDVARVDRILLQLGRFYKPFVNEPVVDLATRQKIGRLLEASRGEEARSLLDERLSLYARFDESEPGGQAPP